MIPHGTPYLRFLIPFIAGLSLGACFETPLPAPVPFFITAAVFGAILAVQKIPYRFRWVFGSYMHLLLFIFGYAHMAGYNELLQKDHFSNQAPMGRYALGEVYEAPSRGGKIKIPIRLEAIGNAPDALEPVSGNVMLFLDPSAFADSVRYGDRLAFRANIRPTEAPKNPHAFDYARYLHFQNIHHQAFVKPDSIQCLSAGHGQWVWRKAYQCRENLLSLLRKYFPGTDEYAVASALLVGYTDDLSDDLRTAYAETGSMHALAVSGTHIGMLYVGLMFLIGRLRLRGKRGRLMETSLILLGIWAFTFLTGATASVLRASVMFSIYMLGKTFWRESSAWNVLPASAFILLWFNPYLLFNVGFQLSYAAVVGMVFFYPRFYKMFPPLSRWLDEPLKVFLVGLSAQLGTLPLSLFYFNQFPVFFWLAGWVVVFVGAVFMWGGAMLVLADALSQVLADWLGLALYYMVWGMNRIIFFIQSIPGGVIRNVWIPGGVVAVLYACLAVLGAAMVSRRGVWLGAFFGLMSLLGLYRLMVLTPKHQQRQIIVYSLNKNSLVDFFDGVQRITLSDTLSRKQENFAASAHRIASGIREKKQVFWADPLEYKDQNLWIEKPFVQFFNRKLVFLDDPKWVNAGQEPSLPVDLLVLSKSPDISIAGCRARFPCKMLVFDASNTPRQTERWRKECEAAGWPFHDVRTMGAWMDDLNNP